MRITNNMLANTFLRDLYYNNQRTARVQNQIATGRIVNNPSEDPLVSDQVLGLNLQISRAAQYLRNGAAGSSYLSLADSSLGDVNNMAVSARTLAVQMANDTVNASMRAGGAQEVQQLLEQSVEVANRRFRGRFIFGGLQTTQAPFELTADGVLYRGDMGHINLRMSDSSLNQINVNGADAFGAFNARVMGTVDLAPALTPLTRLADLPIDAASGFTISNSSAGTPVTITMPAGGTVQDLLTEINNSAANVYAEIAADGKRLNIYSRLSGPTMTITENLVNPGPPPVYGTTAADLGIDTAGVRADNVFTALMDLRDALNANDGQAVAATIGQLDTASDQLLRARAEVGARVQRFEATNSRQDDAKYNLTKLLSEANDADYSKTIVEFQQLQNVLEASLRMGAQMLPLSLADFL